jgi:hypothetical protein
MISQLPSFSSQKKIKKQTKIFPKKRSTKRNMNILTRFEKLRDKNFVYPKSVENKIVFVSTNEGNGFRK